MAQSRSHQLPTFKTFQTTVDLLVVVYVRSCEIPFCCNVWGIFEVPDACCASTAPSGRKLLGGSCMPFSRNPSRRSGAPWQLLQNPDRNALLELLAWLATQDFVVRWGPNGHLTGGVRDFSVYEDVNSGSLVFEEGRQPGGGCSAAQCPSTFLPIRALVVPQILATERTLQQTPSRPEDRDRADIVQVPPSWYLIPRAVDNNGQGYVSIDLPRNGARSSISVILTPLFTGCAFAIGVANGQVHMAHLQPNDPASSPPNDPRADRGSLAELLRDRAGIDGPGFSLRGAGSNFYTFGGLRATTALSLPDLSTEASRAILSAVYAPISAPRYFTGNEGYLINARLIGIVFENTIMFLVRFEDRYGIPRVIIIDASQMVP